MNTHTPDNPPTPDVASPSGRVLLTRAVNERWPIDRGTKLRICEALDAALAEATAAGRVRDIASLARCVAAIESVNQALLVEALRAAAQAQGEPDDEGFVTVRIPLSGARFAEIEIDNEPATSAG